MGDRLNDVGDWGDKPLSGYLEPLRIGGEEVDLDSLPEFGGPVEDPADGPDAMVRTPLKP